MVMASMKFSHLILFSPPPPPSPSLGLPLGLPPRPPLELPGLPPGGPPEGPPERRFRFRSGGSGLELEFKSPPGFGFPPPSLPR